MSERSSKAKVAIITPGTFTVPSECSSSVERIVEETSKRLKDRLEIVIFSKKAKAAPIYERQDGITHIRPHAGSRREYRNAVHRWLRKVEPDLIQVENRPHLVRRMKRRHRGTPVWLSLHSVTFLSSKRIAAKRLRRNLAAADRIVVNSAFLKAELARRYPRFRHKILINHPGTDTDKFTSQWDEAVQKQREEQKRRLGYEGRSIVIYMGRLRKIKGVHYLLQSWNDVVRRHPQALLLIVGSAYYGSGKMTPYVRRLHRMAGAHPSSVRFIPRVKYGMVPDWYRIADVAVVPSLEKEAFGLVNVEAAASGVPVIASASGGIGEIIKDGENGYLIGLDQLKTGLAERICELLGEPEKRKSMGICGAAIARGAFAWQHAADRQFELYARHSHILKRAGDGRRDE